MPLSLKLHLKKFAHKGQITQEEYDALIKKSEGHDKEIRNKAIDEFAEKLKRNFRDIGAFTGYEVKREIDEIAEHLKEE